MAKIPGTVPGMVTDSPAAVPAPTVPDDATRARANLFALSDQLSGTAMRIFLKIPAGGGMSADDADLSARLTLAASAAFTAAMLPAPVAQTSAEEPWVVVDTRANLTGDDGLPFLTWDEKDRTWGWDDKIGLAHKMTPKEAESEVRKRSHVEGLVAVPLSRAADVARGSR